MDNQVTNQPIITKQAALDRFVNDRLIGNVPVAMDFTSRCVYDKKVNGGCAIGCMIPDEFMTEQVANYTYGVYELFNKFPYIKNLFEDPNSDFWRYLQRAHDLIDPYSWQSCFKNAVRYL